MISNKFRTKIKGLSPFEFKTLKEIPWPTMALPVTILFFCLAWHVYEKKHDNSVVVAPELAEFVAVERSEIPYKQEVFIVGSSYAGMGTYTDLLEKLTKKKVSKVTLSNGLFWEFTHMIKKYQDELDGVKLLIVELRPASFLRLKDVSRYKDRFTFFHGIEWPDHPGENRSLELLLPMRFSLRDICKHQSKTFKRTNGREKYWRTLHEEKYALVYAKAFPLASKSFHEKITHKREDSVRDIVFDDSLAKQPAQFVDYCAKRGIFVVFNVYPQEVSRSVPMESDDLPEGYKKYWEMLHELNDYPNCAVIAATCFHDIIPNMNGYYNKNPRLTFDGAHMTKHGATIYTTWLANWMLDNPKVVAALEKNREPNEFFVKQFTRSAWLTVVGHIDRPTSTVSEEKTIKLASPDIESPTR